MSGNQRKYEYLASVCDALAQSASTPEQRETFVDLAQVAGHCDEPKTL